MILKMRLKSRLSLQVMKQIFKKLFYFFFCFFSYTVVFIFYYIYILSRHSLNCCWFCVTSTTVLSSSTLFIIFSFTFTFTLISFFIHLFTYNLTGSLAANLSCRRSSRVIRWWWVSWWTHRYVIRFLRLHLQNISVVLHRHLPVCFFGHASYATQFAALLSAAPCMPFAYFTNSTQKARQARLTFTTTITQIPRFSQTTTLCPHWQFHVVSQLYATSTRFSARSLAGLA